MAVDYPPQIECGAHEQFACTVCWPAEDGATHCREDGTFVESVARGYTYDACDQCAEGFPCADATARAEGVIDLVRRWERARIHVAIEKRLSEADPSWINPQLRYELHQIVDGVCVTGKANAANPDGDDLWDDLMPRER